MDIKAWSEVEISEPEAVLFIYLMFRKKYGYLIAQEFSKAIQEKKWDDRRGLGSLKHANRVESFLKKMVRKNLLIEVTRPGVGRPKKKSIEEDMVNNPRRKYYRVNPNVFAMSHSISLTDEDIEDIRKHRRANKDHIFNPDEISIEDYAFFSFAIIPKESFKVFDKTGDFYINYPPSVRKALHLVELCAPKELSCIQFINSLKEYDYLTILMTGKKLFKELFDFISPDFYTVRFWEGTYFFPLDLSEEELKKIIRTMYKASLKHITGNKNKRLNSIIADALELKKEASLWKPDLDFLYLKNINKKIEQIQKEFGITYEKSDVRGDLETIIKCVDDIINEVPYIERGFEMPNDATIKKLIEETQSQRKRKKN